ncbi:MAG: hypothetical protein AAB581_00515 [Patescibacteria group bacterium]
MGKFKLSLPITILLASIVLGGFYYASEANKQKSTERQQRDEQVVTEKNLFDLKWCLATAEGDRKDFLRLNGPDGHIDGRYTNNTTLIQQAERQKKEDEQRCYQLYK